MITNTNSSSIVYSMFLGLISQCNRSNNYCIQMPKNECCGIFNPASNSDNQMGPRYIMSCCWLIAGMKPRGRLHPIIINYKGSIPQIILVCTPIGRFYLACNCKLLSYLHFSIVYYENMFHLWITNCKARIIYFFCY